MRIGMDWFVGVERFEGGGVGVERFEEEKESCEGPEIRQINVSNLIRSYYIILII
jgi:hypothetical protein